MKGSTLLTALGLSVLAVSSVVARRTPDRFDHVKHAALFPSCVSCHAGATRVGASIFPSATTSCAGCHDGKDTRVVTWEARVGPRPSNLAFDHLKHPRNAECLSCHADAGARWMDVRAATPQGCFSCHGQRTEHLAQPDSTCESCHRPLAEVPAIVTAARVGQFPAPPSHRSPGFGADGGHAVAAKGGDRSCATCHARDFCAECHANGATLPAVASLGADPRSLAIAISQRGPATHSRDDFERAHAGQARNAIQSCATCHTQMSCLACHTVVPRAARTLAVADPRPGHSMTDTRSVPASHRTGNWSSAHGALASARPASCASCHARSECLDCHRPDAGSGTGYHPSGFLAGHPAQAYGRQSSCADCHNTQSFCQDCHRQSGVVASARLQGGFHDSKQAFVLGHGQAARQALESCVSCHAERDCLACHSATRGRRFNPHGPGFDARRLKEKNPGMCVACHAPGSV